MADDATTLDYTTGDYTVVESAAAGPPGVGVPSGGTTGQALTKASGTDYDTHWATPSTVAALDDLTDVFAPTPANGDGLVFNGTAWVNVDVATQAELNAHTGATGTSVHGLGSAATHAAGDFDAAGTASSAVSAHVAAVDPHGDRAYAAGLVDDLSGVTDAATARTNLGLGTAATKNVPASGDAASGEVVKGDDSRLTDARTPTGSAGGDLTGTYPNPTLATVATAGTTGDSTHVPGVTIDAKGRVTGITSNAIPSAAAAATPSLRALGTGATDACAGNDSRLSDTRTPTDNSVTSAKIVDGAIVNADINASAAIDFSKLAAPAADFSMNSHKITNVTAGTTTGNAATYEQTPASILTTQGDMLYASSANTPARLAKGTAFQILRTNSGATAPEWVSGGLHLIAETTLGASAANFDFTSIPSGYRHLMVVWLLRSDVSATSDSCLTSLNNDTTNANYDRQYFQAVASSTTAVAVNAGSGSRAGLQSTGATSPANQFGTGYLLVADYTSSQYKTVHGFGNAWTNRSSSTILMYHWVQGWANTAAVTRITIAPGTGSNFVSGSAVQLYGVG